MSPKHNRDFILDVVFINGILGVLWSISTSNQHRRTLAPYIQDKLDTLCLLYIHVIRNPRLNYMEISQLQIPELFNKVRELWLWVGHAHTLEAAPGADAVAKFLWSNSIGY